MQLTSGDTVTLNTPDNPRLHNAAATVAEVTEWGAHVLTDAAATGRFRAAWGEMVLPAVGGLQPSARDQGFTGDICTRCQGCRMRRNGACLLCADCGETSGCS